MPFPFHHLHIDLQKRLRALATPSQLYHLQIAAGGAHHYLHPVQRCYVLDERDCCLLEKTEGEWSLTNFNGTGFSKGSDLVLVKYLQIDFKDVTEACLDCLRTHGTLDIEKLNLTYTRTNALMLRRLALVCSKTCTTLHFGCAELFPEITFQFTFNLFPNLDEISIYVKGKKYWIDDLLKSKKTGMKYLKGYLDSPDHDDEEDYDNDDYVGLRYIQPKSVFEFCKTQPSDFKLEFCFTYPYEDSPTPETWDFLKPYFRVTDNEKDCKILMTTWPRETYMYGCYA